MPAMSSSKPYLIRALYEWIVDNGLTPHLLVDASLDDVLVPAQYVKGGKIVLNISPAAARDLGMDNTAVTFSARFGGAPMSVYVPVRSVIAIYARENGHGMVLSTENDTAEVPEPTGQTPTRDRPVLKRIK